MKALHLQKKKAPANSSSFGPRKLSSDAWYNTDKGKEGDGNSWSNLKTTLIAFHDTAKTISLATLVGYDSVVNLCAAEPFDTAKNLYSMAAKAMEFDDYHDGKVMILAASIVCQAKTTDGDDIIDFVEENDCSDEKYDENLAEALPFCFEAHNVTREPQAMRSYLDSLDIDQLEAKIASSEPLVSLVFKDGVGNTTEVSGINSLLSLNEVLAKHCLADAKVSNVRVKHNGTRLFISSAGKKSLADLNVANNDTIEIEDINASSCDANFIDITNKMLKVGSGGSGKRSKRKGKKGKGKK